MWKQKWSMPAHKSFEDRTRKKDVELLLNQVVTKSDKIKVKIKSHNIQGQNTMTSLGGPYQKNFSKTIFFFKLQGMSIAKK